MSSVDPSEVAQALHPDEPRESAPDVAEVAVPPPWGPPVPFDALSVPGFPADALPPWLAEFVKAESEATQTPADVAAMLTLAVVAAACAKRFEIQLKEGYLEPVNIFTVVVMQPGNRKSTVFKHVASPLEDYEAEELKRIMPLIDELKSRRRIDEERLKRLETQAAHAEPAQREAAAEQAIELARSLAETSVPVMPRLLVDDCSPERLATLLRDHGGRMAVLAPEGDVFDLMSGRYSSTGAPNFGVYLRGHAGDDLRVDRVGRAPEFVQAVAVTIGLAVQPEVLRGLMSRSGFRGRGLLGRFLYSLPVSLLGRRNVDAPPVPRSISAAYWREIHRLLTLPVDVDESGVPIRRVLILDPAAGQRFRAFEKDIEPRLGETGDLGHMADWAGKLAGAVARLAALLHAADPATRHAPWAAPITINSVENAIRIGEYLIPHAEAAYGAMGGDPEVESARQILGWINRAGVESFTKREAYQALKGRFKRVAEMGPALAVLVEQGYIRERDQPGERRAGRPSSPTYEVNPLVQFRQVQDARQQASETRSEDCGDSGNES